MHPREAQVAWIRRGAAMAHARRQQHPRARLELVRDVADREAETAALDEDQLPRIEDAVGVPPGARADEHAGVAGTEPGSDRQAERYRNHTLIQRAST